MEHVVMFEKHREAETTEEEFTPCKSPDRDATRERELEIPMREITEGETEREASETSHEASQAHDTGGRKEDRPRREHRRPSIRQELEERSGIYLQRLTYLAELKRKWEEYLYKLRIGLQRFKQLDKKEKTASMFTRKSTKEDINETRSEKKLREERAQYSTVESDEGASGDWRRAKMEKKAGWQGSQGSSGATRSHCDMSLVPVNNRLVPLSTQRCRDTTVPWNWTSCHIFNLRQCLSWLAAGLLLLLLFGILLLLISVPQSGREHMWTSMKMTVWPHIQLRYLRPPPV
ncbi:uncharacterized protein [Ambystoma mexicanum]|uniref:uncharacterized protein n=1 Tax=Ambystoma mexicanum TaxID=8296 RepID=UPI0037E91120